MNEDNMPVKYDAKEIAEAIEDALGGPFVKLVSYQTGSTTVTVELTNGQKFEISVEEVL